MQLNKSCVAVVFCGIAAAAIVLMAVGTSNSSFTNQLHVAQPVTRAQVTSTTLRHPGFVNLPVNAATGPVVPSRGHQAAASPTETNTTSQTQWSFSALLLLSLGALVAMMIKPRTPARGANEEQWSVMSAAGEQKSTSEKLGEAVAGPIDAVGQMYDSVTNKARDLGQAGQQKATQAYDTVAGKSQEMKDSASGKASELSEQAKQQAGNVSNKAGELKDQAGQKVASATDAVGKKAQETKEAAQRAADTVKESAKQGYEGAKHGAGY